MEFWGDLCRNEDSVSRIADQSYTPTFRLQLYCDDDVLRFRFETFIGTSSVHNLADSILRTNFVNDLLRTRSCGQNLVDKLLRTQSRERSCERNIAHGVLHTTSCERITLRRRGGFPSPPSVSPHHESIRDVPLSSTVATMRLREYLPGESLAARVPAPLSRSSCSALRANKHWDAAVGRLWRCFVAMRRSIVFAVRVTLPCRCVRPLRLRVCGCEYLSSRRFSFPSDRVSAS